MRLLEKRASLGRAGHSGRRDRPQVSLLVAMQPLAPAIGRGEGGRERKRLTGRVYGLALPAMADLEASASDRPTDRQAETQTHVPLLQQRVSCYVCNSEQQRKKKISA